MLSPLGLRDMGVEGGEGDRMSSGNLGWTKREGLCLPFIHA